MKKSVSNERVDSSTGEIFAEVVRPRSRYSPRIRVGLDCGASMAKQSFKDECDINVIMRRYEATGILPGAERAAGARYMDCTGYDYQEAQLLVASARTMFQEMPARLRDRFKNDPARLMEFLENPNNLEEARELGLVNPKAKEATPLAVRVVEPARSDPSALPEPFKLEPSPPTGTVPAEKRKGS